MSMSQFSVPLSQASGVYELETDSETETALERSCGNALLRQLLGDGDSGSMASRSCGNALWREAWPLEQLEHSSLWEACPLVSLPWWIARLNQCRALMCLCSQANPALLA